MRLYCAPGPQNEALAAHPPPRSRGLIMRQGLFAAGANAPWPLFRTGTIATAYASIQSGTAGGSNGSTGSRRQPIGELDAQAHAARALAAFIRDGKGVQV